MLYMNPNVFVRHFGEGRYWIIVGAHLTHSHNSNSTRFLTGVGYDFSMRPSRRRITAQKLRPGSGLILSVSVLLWLPDCAASRPLLFFYSYRRLCSNFRIRRGWIQIDDDVTEEGSSVRARVSTRNHKLTRWRRRSACKILPENVNSVNTSSQCGQK